MTEDEIAVIAFCAMLVYFLIDSYIDTLKARKDISKEYGAGNWPQPITEPPKNPNFGVNEAPKTKRPKPSPTPPKKPNNYRWDD